MKVSREPALWVGVIGSILTAAAAINLPGLNGGQAAALTAFISALVIAVFTRPVGPAVFVGALSALAAVLLEYGVHLPDAWIGLVTSMILGGFTLAGVRPQVTPTTASGHVIEGRVVSSTTVAV